MRRDRHATALSCPDDDAGYLLTYVHDEAIDVSELVIVDASDVLAGPVARIKLPTRVPYGSTRRGFPTEPLAGQTKGVSAMRPGRLVPRTSMSTSSPTSSSRVT